MLRIVLIDDEILVLRGMTMILEEEEEIEIVGTAQDGVTGLNLILDKKPELVFTDIRMPALTGLEMIEQVQQKLPNTVFVIFSGFNEFKYVQKAISFGVLDYLEKPVTVEDLQKTLERAKQIIEYKNNYIRMKERSTQVNRVLIEKALYNLRNQPVEREAANLEQLAVEGAYLQTAVNYCVLSVSNLCNRAAQTDEYRQLINGVGFSIIQDQQMEVFVLDGNEEIIFIYFNFGSASYPFYETITRAKDQLQDQEIYFYAGISNIYSSIYEMKAAFSEAHNALTYASYLELDSVTNISSVEYKTSIPAELYDSQYSIEMNFRMGNYDICRKYLKAYFSYLRKANLISDMLKTECIDLLYLLYQLCDEAGHAFNKADLSNMRTDILKKFSADEIVGTTQEKTEQILRSMDHIASEKAFDATLIVKKYIDQHYAESISLETLSDVVHMSSTYLSVIFKKREGITYNHYLTKVRMEHAKELLQKGEKAKDVCLSVGYFDFRYFNKQFKKYTGMTPDTYKKDYIAKHTST